MKHEPNPGIDNYYVSELPFHCLSKSCLQKVEFYQTKLYVIWHRKITQFHTYDNIGFRWAKTQFNIDW